MLVMGSKGLGALRAEGSEGGLILLGGLSLCMAKLCKAACKATGVLLTGCIRVAVQCMVYTVPYCFRS